MSVWVHRKDENGEVSSELVDAKHLESCLSSGYVVDINELTGEATQGDNEFFSSDISQNDDNSVDFEAPGQLPEDIRQAAKAAGIEGWDNKRIGTLRKELGYVD